MPKHRPRKKTKGAKKHSEPVFMGVVRDLTSDGLGVVEHPDGRVFFVAGVWPGETVEVRPIGRRGKAFLGQPETITAPDTKRRVAPCVHHGNSDRHCGGCPWMFMAYDAQCAAKIQRLQRVLADLESPRTQVDPLLRSPEELGYRNRAQFKTDGRQLGYVAAGTHQLVDVGACPILTAGAAQHLAALRSQLPNPNWQRKKGAGNPWLTLAVDDELAEPSEGGRLGFRQGNTAQNQRMREWLANTIAALPAQWRVLELFAGTGNFTDLLAQHFDQVVALEGDQQAASTLRDRLGPGVSVQSTDLFVAKNLTQMTQTYSDSQLLVLDPPRDGLPVRAPVIEGLADLRAVIYISCNAATWRRDCLDFLAAGFELDRVTPVDLFPQTPHLEIMSLLVRP